MFAALGSIKTIFMVGVIVAVLTVIGGLWWEHHEDQITIQNQAANIATLTAANQTEQNTIDSLGKDLKEADAATAQAQRTSQQARTALENTRNQITILQKNAKIDPQKTETDSNVAMNKSVLCLSIISGAAATSLGLDDKGFNDAKNSCN